MNIIFADRYAALKDLDEQIREIKVKEVQQQQVVQAPPPFSNPNPFKAAPTNPFSTEANLFAAPVPAHTAFNGFHSTPPSNGFNGGNIFGVRQLGWLIVYFDVSNLKFIFSKWESMVPECRTNRIIPSYASSKDRIVQTPASASQFLDHLCKGLLRSRQKALNHCQEVESPSHVKYESVQFAQC